MFFVNLELRREAAAYGIVVYDWSNAKDLWANARPMTCEEALTEQAKMVMPLMPQRPGYQPRVWVYRSTLGLTFCGRTSRASVLYLAAHNRAAVCLYVAPIEILRAFWTDWYPQKLNSAP